MKVEKCPRCGKEPIGLIGTYFMVICKSAGEEPHYYRESNTRTIAYDRWNRWARREAKRIAKEGKGK